MTEAIILAGGLGTRLQHVVHDLPKSMAPVDGRPFLEYQLDFLNKNTVDKVILSVGYRNEAIIRHFGSKYRHLAIDYAIEAEPLGTGGGIRLALEMCETADTLVLNGDTLFLVEISEMFRLHVKSKASVSIALRKVPDASRFGSVQIDQNMKIISFGEKSAKKQPGFINGGIYLLNREFYLSHTPPGCFSIERECFGKWASEGFITGFPSDAYFLDIGIPEDYERAQHEFKTIKY